MDSVKVLKFLKKTKINVFDFFNKLFRCTMSSLMYFIYTDIDECQDSSICPQICNNTEGSYKCSCNHGFKLENGKDCVDINECLDTKCHDCENLPGSFKCFCEEGFIIDPITQNGCNSMKRLLFFHQHLNITYHYSYICYLLVNVGINFILFDFHFTLYFSCVNKSLSNTTNDDLFSLES